MRLIRTAEILAVGSELTTGVTRDTNSGELAAELTGRGVRVLRSSALPDDLEAVRRAFENAMSNADLVVSTGGLGPTPDDLTREAIAAACGLEPRVDPDLEAWLRGLFSRRGLAMPEANVKQAWLVDGCVALANNHGSAPGWWLERTDGGLLIALPGPPREWRAMWRDQAVSRLEAGRLGAARAVQTLRLSGIGESALVALIGEDVLRAPYPQVATYARMDAVDVVVSAETDDRTEAQRVVDATVTSLRERVGEYVFAEGNQTWVDALAVRLRARTLAVVEIGTAGNVQALLGGASFLVSGRLLGRAADVPVAEGDLGSLASEARAGGADIGLAVLASEARGDTGVHVAIATASDVTEEKALAFLGGDEGRRRAALSAASILWRYLGRGGADRSPS
jgi:nicotinamide-nucleotide amidase